MAAAHMAAVTLAPDPCAPALMVTSWMKTRRPALVRASSFQGALPLQPQDSLLHPVWGLFGAVTGKFSLSAALTAWAQQELQES